MSMYNLKCKFETGYCHAGLFQFSSLTRQTAFDLFCYRKMYLAPVLNRILYFKQGLNQEQQLLMNLKVWWYVDVVSKGLIHCR